METVTHSIFEPRQAFLVNKKTGVAEKTKYFAPTGPKEYDKFYIKRVLKFVPVPVSEGSEDYILDLKVIDDKEDIAQLINSQAAGVGLDVMLEKFNKTGDPTVLPQAVQATDDIMDFTKLPQDDAEYFEYIHALAAKFKNLPIELRGDMTESEFIQKVTQKQVDDYIASLMIKEEKKDE